MYRSTESKHLLERALARIHQHKPAIAVPAPIVYSSNEITSARKVLERIKTKRKVCAKAVVVSIIRTKKIVEEP